MAFDAREYRTRVLSQYSRARARVLADAIRELKQDSKLDVPSQFDLVEFYDVPANSSDEDLVEHIAAVVNAIKAHVRRPGGSKQPLDFHELIAARNPNLRSSVFWDEMAQRRARRSQAALRDFATNAARDFSGLGVVDAKQLREQARRDGIPDSVSDDELMQVVKSEGIAVVGDFPVVNVASKAVQRDVITPLAKTSARTVLTPIFLRKSTADGELQGFSILDGFKTSAPGYALTLGTVSDSSVFQQQLPDSGDTDGFGKVLTALAKANSDVELLDIVKAYFVEVGKEFFNNSGSRRGALNTFVSQTGIDPIDAGRILLYVMPDGAAQQRTFADVQSLIASGSLKEARRLYGLLVAEQAGSESDVQKKTLAALEGTEYKVNELRQRAASAQKAGDLETAAKALKDALTICSDDETLSAAERALPPAAPARFVASLSEDARVAKLSWEPGFGSTEDVRYQVIRKVGSPPQNNTDGTSLGNVVSATSFEDVKPPAAVKVYYGVSASRGGGASPVAVAEVIALPPVTEIVVTSDPSSVTLRWTPPTEASSVEIIQSSPDGSSVVLAAGARSGTSSSGLKTGITYTYFLTALYIGGTGEQLRSRTERITAVPRGTAKPVTELLLSAKPMTGTQPEIGVEWVAIDGYAVEIWHYPQKPSWLYGTRLPMAEVQAQGTQVAGRSLANSGRDGVHGATRQGLRYYVAITRDGEFGLIGACRPYGTAPAVQNLRAERFGAEAVLSWDWPGAEYEVRVTWTGSGTGERTISMSDYRKEGGCRIQIGSAGGTVAVASLAGDGDTRWLSPETSIVVAGGEHVVSYDVEFQKKIWGSPSDATLTFKFAETLPRIDVVVIGHYNKFMPFDATQGFELKRTTITADAAEVFVNIPRGKGPLWIRAFTLTPGIRLSDPPTSRMKVG